MYLYGCVLIMDHTVKSLVYVVEQGAARVRGLGDRLQSASPNQLEPILRMLSKEADTLSAGLSRLSHHVEAIPNEDDNKNVPPKADCRLLDLSILVQDAIEHGFCDQCGGVLQSP
jgi:hypothetical protein